MNQISKAWRKFEDAVPEPYWSIDVITFYISSHLIAALGYVLFRSVLVVSSF